MCGHAECTVVTTVNVVDFPTEKVVVPGLRCLKGCRYGGGVASGSACGDSADMEKLVITATPYDGPADDARRQAKAASQSGLQRTPRAILDRRNRLDKVVKTEEGCASASATQDCCRHG